MLIPSAPLMALMVMASLSRRVNANSQRKLEETTTDLKLIKKGEC